MTSKQITWLLMAVATSVAAYWLWRQPAVLSSDDAFYFSQGIQRFSVLEFAPHFPGYPAFIALARLLTPWVEGPTQALVTVTRLAALALPWLSYALLNSAGCRQPYALLGFLLCLSQPLLLGLGLQGLSDAPGLVWLLAFLLMLLRSQFLLAGLMLGLALATRPSYAPILLAPLCWLLYLEPRQLRQLLPGVSFIGVLCLSYLLYRDGTAYFAEGWRFLQGHFQVWGNSSIGADHSGSWGQSLAHYFGHLLIPLALVLPLIWLTCRQRTPAVLLLLLTWLCSLIWTLSSQNPLNLRHLAPSLVLLICLLCLALSRLSSDRLRAFGSTCLLAGGLTQTLLFLEWQPRLPPLQQAIVWIEQQPAGLLATNYGVDLLRHQLTHFSVADAYYPGTSRRVLQRGGWRLSATQMNYKGLVMEQTFSARFPGERNLWLYRLGGMEDRKNKFPFF